jgi:hypothetical protein
MSLPLVLLSSLRAVPDEPSNLVMTRRCHAGRCLAAHVAGLLLLISLAGGGGHAAAMPIMVLRSMCWDAAATPSQACAQLWSAACTPSRRGTRARAHIHTHRTATGQGGEGVKLAGMLVA